MKTFNDIYEIIRNEEWAATQSLDYYQVNLATIAAKEYAKQWVEQAAYVAMDQAAYGDPVGDAVLKLLQEIDAQ